VHDRQSSVHTGYAAYGHVLSVLEVAGAHTRMACALLQQGAELAHNMSQNLSGRPANNSGMPADRLTQVGGWVPCPDPYGTAGVRFSIMLVLKARDSIHTTAEYTAGHPLLFPSICNLPSLSWLQWVSSLTDDSAEQRTPPHGAEGGGAHPPEAAGASSEVSPVHTSDHE
jgi:hypothetical protein